MLRLRKISLIQFKNYQACSLGFNDRIIGICGPNGAGKTNLLDAIHYLCFTKSYFTRTDATSILRGHDGFRIEGEFGIWEKTEEAICVFKESARKEFSVNGQVYERFSEHIGRYPCVIVAPDDIQILTGGSEERRRFVDTLLCQLDMEYLQQLIIYNKVLQQRNFLLRSFLETGFPDLSLLQVLDEQLVRAGNKVFEKRRLFLVGFLPAVRQIYFEIAKASPNSDLSKEDLHLFYNSDLLLASFDELLRIGQVKDMAAARTTSGIHKDDLEFTLNDQPLRNIASQGQRKSLLFALKLAELDAIRKEKKLTPLLLLDDVFEKLDEARVNNLLRNVCVENDGQVFITDTSKERLALNLSALHLPYQLIELR